MWTRRAVYGVLVSLLAFLLHIPDVTAREAKTAKSAASGNKKLKRNVTATKAVPSKRKASRHPAKARKKEVRKVAAVPRKAAQPAVHSVAALAGLNDARDPLKLSSSVAFAMDMSTSRVLFEKHADIPLPIASITKLMTALVVIESGQNMGDVLEVTHDDVDKIKFTSSRLPIGAKLTRADMLHIALMSSENRAASALGRNYPGGLPAFVAAMNAKARELDMINTHYVEPTGLSSENVASARDLAKLVAAVHAHPLLALYSTNSSYDVDTGRHTLTYVNSNRLVGNDNWEIELQKTGYIREAGRCLAMQVKIEDRPVVMVFLDASGHLARFADAGRLREWVVNRISPETTAEMKQGDDQS